MLSAVKDLLHGGPGADVLLDIGRADVRHAYDLLLDEEINADILITHHESLDNLEHALQLVLERSAIKVAVHP